MIIKKEDVIGYHTNSGTLCYDCAEKNCDSDYWDNLTSDNVLTEHDRDDDEYLFCDQCKIMI